MQKQIKMIVIGQYTTNPFERCQLINGLMTVEQVFRYFEPMAPVLLEAEDGTKFQDVILYKRVADFGIKSLTSRTDLLNDLKIKKVEYENIISQFSLNDSLKQVIDNKVTRQYLVDAFEAMIPLSGQIDQFSSPALTPSSIWQGLKVNNYKLAERKLTAAIAGLKDAGGFSLIESTAIDEVKNLNWARNEGRGRLFLEDSANRKQRDDFKKKLCHWIDLLASSNDNLEISSICKTKLPKVERLLKRNLKAIEKQTSEMEKAYRTLSLVFRYNQNDAAKDIYFINADSNQLDCTCFTDIVRQKLLQLVEGINQYVGTKLLIVPSYPGSNKEVQRWKGFARDNNIFLIIDDEGGLCPDQMLEKIETELNKWQFKQEGFD